MMTSIDPLCGKVSVHGGVNVVSGDDDVDDEMPSVTHSVNGAQSPVEECSRPVSESRPVRYCVRSLY